MERKKEALVLWIHELLAMTKKDYELLTGWLKDYSYLATIRQSSDGEQRTERHWYTGAAAALAIRLKQANSDFNAVKFAEQSGIDLDELQV